MYRDGGQGKVNGEEHGKQNDIQSPFGDYGNV